MPQISSSARGKFNIIFADLRKASHRVEDLWDAAVSEGNVDEIVELSKARKNLKNMMWQMRGLEMEYQASSKTESEAEGHLAEAATEIRAHANSVKSIADGLNAIANVANIIGRLLVIFP